MNRALFAKELRANLFVSLIIAACTIRSWEKAWMP